MVLGCCCSCFFFFKQKPAYEMRISDWSSDVCSSDLDPLQRIRPEDDLDPVNEKAVDGEAVAAAVAQRGRLRDTVDRIKRRTAAQRFARTRQFLARRDRKRVV